jgi:signal peptidase I
MIHTQWKNWLAKFWRGTAKPMLVIILVTCAFRSAIADWNDVPTGSMKPTIIEGDRVFVNKLAYDLKVPFTTWHLAQWSHPQRGDIVVFFSPADEIRLIKRVVGLPGDEIQLVNERLYVNGKPASYEPLSEKMVEALPLPEKPSHLFVNESVADAHAHPVMITPLAQAPRDFGPIVVKADHYFMMGDNRDNSFDSRFYGAVERQRIVGRASSVVISLDRQNYFLPRWNRFFSHML